MFPKPKRRKFTNGKREWSPSEILFLRTHANTMKDEDIAHKLHRTIKSVREKRKRLDLTKGHGRGHFQLKDNTSPVQPTSDIPTISV